MGSRKYTGPNGPKTLVTFLKARHRSINMVLLCGSWFVLLVIGSQATHAQLSFDPSSRGLVPQSHRLPPSGGLRDSFENDTDQYRVKSAPKRRTIPTLRARYRPQDGDLFGEGQADSTADGSIFDQLEKGPQPPATKNRPPRENPFGEPRQEENPFGEPKKRTPLDPSPREPLMDTQREQPVPNRRPRKRTPRQRGRNGAPQLPEGSEFTPSRESITDMPLPGGGTRSTDKAGTEPREEEDPMDLSIPEEDPLDDIDVIEPGDRSPRSSDERESSRRRQRTTERTSDRTTERSQEDSRRRNRGSNVYRPARDPSYYSSPTDSRSAGYGETYGQYPQGYDPSPYASQPYAVPSSMQNVVNQAVHNAMRSYAANPANPAVASYYGRDNACPPCPPVPGVNCDCGPQRTLGDSADLRQQFMQPASSPSSPGLANDVYEGVVCGDQEIESFDPRNFPRKKSGLSIGGISMAGLGIGAIQNDGPGIYYGSLFGGAAWLDDLMLSGDEGQTQIGNDSGVTAGFAIGQIQGKNLRSELEVTYRSNDLDGMTLNDLSGATQLLEGDGRIESISGMLNVFWDFTDSPTLFKPYLGGGFGGVSADADFQVDGMRTFGDGNDTSLAYQWIAGINFQTERLTDFFVEYRYFAADSLHFNTTLPEGSLIDGDGELEYRTSSIVFGMRLKF